MRRALSLFAKAAVAAEASATPSYSCLCLSTRGGVAGTSSSGTTVAMLGSTSNCNRRSLSALVLGEGGAATRALDCNEQRRISSRLASTTTATAAAAPSASPSTSEKAPTAASAAPARRETSASPPYFEIIGKLEGRVPPPTKQQQQADPVFAVVDFGGTQHKACPGDLLYADGWLPGADVNDVVRLTRVLAAGSPSRTKVGRPVLEGASVTAAVEELFLDAKQLHFVKRRRKASRRLKGHRQPLTALRVLEVSVEGF